LHNIKILIFISYSYSVYDGSAFDDFVQAKPLKKAVLFDKSFSNW